MLELRPYRPEPVVASGFWEQLGIPLQGNALIEQVRAGFSFATLERLAVASAFTETELAGMVGLSRYALRQGRRKGRLSTPQSDRLYRVARIIAAASELFRGDQVAVKQWLVAPQFGLGGVQPVAMLATEIEGNVVLNLIGRIEHSVAI
ncbi:MAG: antitoxin Xre-like helix-turn-helix domain-containing protein [Pseudomonas sp.]